jgi:hypothetical protein
LYGTELMIWTIDCFLFLAEAMFEEGLSSCVTRDVDGGDGAGGVSGGGGGDSGSPSSDPFIFSSNSFFFFSRAINPFLS